MRYFEVLNVQHFVMYFFPTVAFVALFMVGLGFYYIKRKDSAERESSVIERFPEGIEGRNAPFPLIAYLVLYGTIAWVIAYIVLIGVLEVKI